MNGTEILKTVTKSVKTNAPYLEELSLLIDVAYNQVKYLKERGFLVSFLLYSF